ncbi:MAG: response regulator [Beijerinckiaceae bacterium]|nr:response regulator [Beijerinckiaceae bacterium]
MSAARTNAHGKIFRAQSGPARTSAAEWMRTAIGTPAVIVGVLLVSAFWILTAHPLATKAAADMSAAVQNNTNLAKAFSEHVARTVREIDSALRISRKMLRKTDVAFDLSDMFTAASWRSDYVQQLAATDRDGLIVQSNVKTTDQSANAGQQAHVRFHKETSEDRLYIGEPVLGSASNKWSIHFTRRIEPQDPKGSGVVIASVSPDYFSRFYGAFDIGGGSIALISASGTVMARGSLDSFDYTNETHHLKDRIFKAAASGDCFSALSARENKQKLYCAHAVEGTSLSVVMSAPEDEIGNDSREHADHLKIGALITLVSLIFIIAATIKRRRLVLAEAEAERARQAASNSARELRYTLENMCHGIMLIELDGRIAVYNDHAFRFLGLPLPDPGEVVTNDDLCRELAANARNLQFPELRTLHEAICLDAEGFMHCAGIDGRIVKIWTQRVGDGWVRKIEDVTQVFLAERTRANVREREEAASKARAAFVTRISHEIRTPLHAALGFSNLLTREDMPPRARAIADEIHGSTSHLIEVIDEVLDYSTMGSGKMTLADGVVDIRAIVDTVARSGKVLLGHKPVVLRVMVEPRVHTSMAGDERRVRQIVTNLVSNAVKFTDRGEIEIAVSRPLNGAGVIIEVSDTGRGIASTDTNAIFEAFMRTREAEDRPGAGLGLAITKEIVGAMGGNVKVVDKPGPGTTFRVFLPLPEAGSSRHAPERAAPVEPLKILVAEDTRSSLLLIMMMLQARGHRVVSATNGQEAVEANAEEDFDLILLDIQMPVMDGLVAAEIILNNAMRTGRRPLISALTAQVLPEDQAAMRKAGMDSVLRKPFDEKDLDALLHRAAQRKASPRLETSVA